MSYPEHPFVNNIDSLSVEDLQNRITELYNKLSTVYRMQNPNVYVIEQIQMALNSYQTVYQHKLDEQSRDSGLDGLIDVSS